MTLDVSGVISSLGNLCNIKKYINLNRYNINLLLGIFFYHSETHQLTQCVVSSKLYDRWLNLVCSRKHYALCIFVS